MGEAIRGTTWSHGKKTATAGTAIVICVPPQPRLKTKVTKVVVTTGPTAHTLAALRPLGRTTLTAAVSAGASPVLPLAADPGDYANKSTADNLIAGSDYVVVEKPDGTFYVGTVASVSSLNVTMNETAPTGGFASGAKVWFFGVTTDTDPNTALAHPQWSLDADGRSSLDGGPHAALVESLDINQPILLYENNATDAAVVEQAQAIYTAD